MIRRAAQGEEGRHETLRSDHCLVIVLVTLLLSGCTITIGPVDDNGPLVDDRTSVLPEPKQPRGEEPVLDDAQRARKEESERYVAEVIYTDITRRSCSRR